MLIDLKIALHIFDTRLFDFKEKKSNVIVAGFFLALPCGGDIETQRGESCLVSYSY